MPTKDNKPILQKIPPAVREVRHQNEGEDGERFGPRSDILNSSTRFLRLRRQHQKIIEEKLRLGFFSLQVRGKQIAQSKFLPATIWQTSYAGIGETTGLTTNGWSATTEAEGGGTRYPRRETIRQGNWPR